MKKIIICLLILSLFILPLCESKIATSYRHKNDYYAVTFDGEGDAIVSANLQIENTREKYPITILSLEIPKHVILYDATQEYNGNHERIVKDYIFENELKYSTILNIVLPHEIELGEQSSIILTYRIPNDAKKNLFGVYNFDFETIIDSSADLIENVRVSINVVPDLYMKGTGSNVRYKPDYSLMGLQAEITSGKMSGASASYSRAIIKSEGYVKTSSYLDSGESFRVRGKYAKSWFSLNLIKIILALIGGLLLLWFVSLYKKKPKNKTIITKKPKMGSRTKAIITGSISALAMMLLLFTSKFLFEFLEHNLSHEYEFFMPICLFLIVVLNLILLFGPPIYVGIKNKSLLIGVLTFISIIVSFVLILICFAMLTNDNSSLIPAYMQIHL